MAGAMDLMNVRGNDSGSYPMPERVWNRKP
jgi:hypothetical protein